MHALAFCGSRGSHQSVIPISFFFAAVFGDYVKALAANGAAATISK